MEERFLNFWHQSSKHAKWDMEVMLLEDAIKQEKLKIAELDKVLLEHGVEINVEESLLNSTSKIQEQQQQQQRQQSSKCDTNNRTKDSTMPT
jgi:hypothetical protein